MQTGGRHGYTLIEILVVLFIIGIITGVAVLRIHHNETKEMQTLANELTEVFAFLQESALLQSHVYGVSLENHQLVILERLPQTDTQDLTWQRVPFMMPLPEAPDTWVLSFQEAVKDDSTQPAVIITNNGESTPFTLYIGKEGQAPRFSLTGDADGTITQQALN